MDTQKLLKKAIEMKKPIEFEYNREGKVHGKRFGNPHILFVHSTTGSMGIHIFQTGGVSDSDLDNGLPWRLFIVDFIEQVKILQAQSSFEIAEGYNRIISPRLRAWGPTAHIMIY